MLIKFTKFVLLLSVIGILGGITSAKNKELKKLSNYAHNFTYESFERNLTPKLYGEKLKNNCNFSSEGPAIALLCYYFCKQAGHDAAFCLQSCAITALDTDVPPEQSFQAIKGFYLVGGRRMQDEIISEQMRKLKISVLLMEASMFGQTQILRDMINFGGDVNIKVSDVLAEGKGILNEDSILADLHGNDTPLIVAVRYGADVSTVQMLLENNADINALTADGKTALDIATARKRKDIIKLLKTNNTNSLNRD